MTAARGSAQNDSMQASYTSSEYLCLPKRGSEPLIKIREYIRSWKWNNRLNGDIRGYHEGARRNSDTKFSKTKGREHTENKTAKDMMKSILQWKSSHDQHSHRGRDKLYPQDCRQPQIISLGRNTGRERRHKLQVRTAFQDSKIDLLLGHQLQERWVRDEAVRCQPWWCGEPVALWVAPLDKSDF